MLRANKRFGWVPDLPDHRDWLALPTPGRMILPTRVDIRNSLIPIYDQGQLGSCTANAIGRCIEAEQIKQQLKQFTPSRLFIYYNERVIENTVDSDSGAMIRDGIKSVARQGAPPETDWPYDIAKFTDKPSAQAYADARLDRAINYYRLHQTLRYLKGNLAVGYRFAFGFTVYTSFMDIGSDGLMPMPGAHDQVEGGHATVVEGYDDATRRFTVANSWGGDWGDKGYFYMPYEYITDTNLCDDFWTINLLNA
jgi:C1A family cysteine protease